MYIGILAFCSGILVFQCLSELPATSWLLMLPLLLLLWRRPLAWSGWLLIGLLWAWCYAVLSLNSSLEPALEGLDLPVTGCIDGALDQREAGARRFLFTVTAGGRAPHRLKTGMRLRLNWYHAPASLQAGQCWQLLVRLKRPRGFSNPGSFDYETWLFQQGIHATGYIREDGDNRLLLGQSSLSVRQSTLQALDPLLDAQRPADALIRALTLGVRDRISPTQWRVLRASGTSHLIAISGLHIGLLAGLVYALIQLCWRYAGTLAEILPAPRAGAVGAVLAAGVYASLAGFSIPTRRALVMVIVVMLAHWLGRASTPARSLVLALGAVLLLDPLAGLSAGFWLSFCAVAVLVYRMHGRPRPVAWGRVRHWGRLQWGLLAGLAPVLLTGFQQLPLLAPLANALAIPLVGLLVVPLALGGVLMLAVWKDAAAMLLNAAATLLEWLWPLLQGLASLPVALWEQGRPPLWCLPLALAGLLLLLAPRGLPGRWTGLLLLAPLGLTPIAAPAAGEAWFTLLDVGQGLAGVVRTRHHVLVYDTGPAFPSGFNTGEAVVLPFLRHQGLKRVDRLILSHGDNDHVGGARAVLSGIDVAMVLVAEPVPGLNRQQTRCVEGMHWRWDGVGFTILNPPRATGLAGNDASCVLRVETTGGRRLLLSGDIEAATEARLLRQYPQDMAAEVLVAPHHGSNSSSGAAFVAAVSPRYVLFPVGYRNRWGFPRPQVQQRYLQQQAVSLDTAAQGAIEVRLPATGPLPIPVGQRQRERRYWHTREK